MIWINDNYQYRIVPYVNAVWRWYKNSKASDDNAKKQDAIQNLQYYFSHVASGVRLHGFFYTQTTYMYSIVGFRPKWNIDPTWPYYTSSCYWPIWPDLACVRYYNLDMLSNVLLIIVTIMVKSR